MGFAAAAVLLMVVLAVAVAWRDTYRPALRVVRVPVDGLDATYRILQVSDLHGARFGVAQEGLSHLVGDAHYDAVAFTGDMVGGSYDSAIDAARVLSRNGPAVFVRGNHDGADVGAALAEAGVTDLDAAGHVRLKGQSGTLVLATLDGADASRRRDSDTVVVLAHIPPSDTKLERIAKRPADAALVLSGHTHAGTVRLPFVGAVTVPPFGNIEEWTWFPEHKRLQIYGLREQGPVPVYISAGLAASTHGSVPSWWRWRFGTRAEITEVVLEPAR